MVPCCSFQGAALPLRRAQPTERRLAIGLLQLPGRCTALAPRQAGRGAAPQHHRNFQGVALPLHHEPAIPHRLGRPHRNFQGVAQPLHPAHCIVGCGEAHGVAASRAPRSPHASLIGTKKHAKTPDRSFQGAAQPSRQVIRGPARAARQIAASRALHSPCDTLVPQPASALTERVAASRALHCPCDERLELGVAASRALHSPCPRTNSEVAAASRALRCPCCSGPSFQGTGKPPARICCWSRP